MPSKNNKVRSVNHVHSLNVVNERTKGGGKGQKKNLSVSVKAESISSILKQKILCIFGYHKGNYGQCWYCGKIFVLLTDKEYYENVKFWREI